MLRPFDFVMIGVLIAGAAWTFKVKHDSELALARVQKIEKKIASEREEIDLLNADWALVTSPERLQKLAAKYQEQLQLQELDGGQMSTAKDLPPIKIPERTADDFALEVGDDELNDAVLNPDGTLTGSIDEDGSEPTFAPLDEEDDVQ